MESARPSIDEIGWYHTFDLPEGVTRGLFDHRGIVDKLPLPRDMTGMRCLDAAASDGFWGFEMVRRGAEEVVSLDLDDSGQQDYQHRSRAVEGLNFDPGRARRAYDRARESLGVTNITRVDMSVYDASPERLGQFDYVFMGNIMLHLSDPARAATAMRSVTRDSGEFLSFETVSLALSALSRRRPIAGLFVATTRGSAANRNDFNRWWMPNMVCHTKLVEAGGFEAIASGGPVFQPVGSWRERRPTSVPRTFRELHYWTVVRQRGIPSHWVRGRPEPVG